MLCLLAFPVFLSLLLLRQLKASLLTVLGNYDPVVVVYQYNTSSSGYSSYATDIQPDYVWIASAVLLCLVIWCLFKLGGALLRG